MRRKQIHNYIRRYRKQSELSQKDARILGLKCSIVSRWKMVVSIIRTMIALKTSSLYKASVDFNYKNMRQAMTAKLAKRVDSISKVRIGQHG